MKKVLFMVYQAPVGTIWINEAFRTAFGMYGEDIEPSILLIGEGVIALGKRLDPRVVGPLPVNVVLPYVERFGTAVYAVQEDMATLKVAEVDERWNVAPISRSNLSSFVHQFDYAVAM